MSTGPGHHGHAAPATEATSLAAMKEQAAREKAVGTDEKRELAGEDGYLDSYDNKPKSSGLDNPLTGISLDRLEGESLSFAPGS